MFENGYILMHKQGCYCSPNFNSVFDAMMLIYRYDDHDAMLPDSTIECRALALEIQRHLLNTGEAWHIGEFEIGFLQKFKEVEK